MGGGEFTVPDDHRALPTPEPEDLPTQPNPEPADTSHGSDSVDLGKAEADGKLSAPAYYKPFPESEIVAFCGEPSGNPWRNPMRMANAGSWFVYSILKFIYLNLASWFVSFMDFGTESFSGFSDFVGRNKWSAGPVIALAGTTSMALAAEYGLDTPMVTRGFQMAMLVGSDALMSDEEAALFKEEIRLDIERERMLDLDDPLQAFILSEQRVAILSMQTSDEWTAFRIGYSIALSKKTSQEIMESVGIDHDDQADVLSSVYGLDVDDVLESEVASEEMVDGLDTGVDPAPDLAFQPD